MKIRVDEPIDTIYATNSVGGNRFHLEAGVQEVNDGLAEHLMAHPDTTHLVHLEDESISNVSEDAVAPEVAEVPEPIEEPAVEEAPTVVEPSVEEEVEPVSEDVSEDAVEEGN
jgi:hypothetical protein